MKRLFDWIPAFAGMTVHTHSRKPQSIEESVKLALMGGRECATQIKSLLMNS